MDRFSRVTEIIVDILEVDESEVKAEATLEMDLGADELDIVGILMDVEDEYNVTFDDSDLAEIKTVDDILKAIIRRQGK